MSSNHFSYFRVKNFKRFKDLEVKDIGQFNLVLGDNNVGKTSLLEALLFDENLRPDEHLLMLFKALYFRNIGDLEASFKRYYSPAKDFYDRISHPIEISYQKKSHTCYGVDIINTNGNYNYPRVYQFFSELNGVRTVIDEKPADGLSIGLTQNDGIKSVNIPLIPFQNSFDEEISQFYSRFLQGNKLSKKRFIQSLQNLFDKIEDVEPSVLNNRRDTLLIYLSDSDYAIPLAYYGEGMIKLAKVLSYLVKYSGNRVLIDEIDTGMHYSRMKEFWKTIIQTAKENKTQIFATTHNRECIQYFVEALEELGGEYQEKARSIRLVEHAQSKEVVSFTNSYEKIMEELATGNEIR